MRLALFDLDFTLIPFDSTMLWMRFLVEAGEIDPEYDRRYLECCRLYVAGLLDVTGLQRSALAPLAHRRCDEVGGWQARFAQQVLPGELPDAAARLIRRHLDAGDICCIVTATSDLVAAPFARALAVQELLCSRAGVVGERLTGEIEGEPCHGFAKVRRVGAWLAERSLGWDDLESSRFYSDSSSDLPLLSFVGEPVAVAPDPVLRKHAASEGWRIVEALEELP